MQDQFWRLYRGHENEEEQRSHERRKRTGTRAYQSLRPVGSVREERLALGSLLPAAAEAKDEWRGVDEGMAMKTQVAMRSETI